MSKKISTAAFLAGVTTLAVSLPMMAAARPTDVSQATESPAKIIVSEEKTES